MELSARPSTVEDAPLSAVYATVWINQLREIVRNTQPKGDKGTTNAALTIDCTRRVASQMATFEQ